MIPAVFGLQQCLEGVVWLGVEGVVSASAQMAAAYLFCGVAFVLWPAYVPYAVRRFECWRPLVWLVPLQTTGMAVGLYYLWCFAIGSELDLEIFRGANGRGAIVYAFSLPYLDSAINYLYFAVTVFPFFLTRNRRVRGRVGPAFLISVVVAKAIAVPDTFPSVWCFFAALTSLAIFFSLDRVRHIESDRTPGYGTSR